MPAIDWLVETRSLGGPGAINVGGVKLFAVQLAFLIIGWIFILLRAYVRIFIQKKVYMDDYIMFLAVLMYTPYAIIVLHSVVYGGTGAHTDQFTLDGAMISLRAWYLCEVMYSPISAAIRTSIALLLLRIANQKTHKRIIWANLILIWVVCLAYFFVSLFQCLPLDHFWMQFTGQEGSCMSPLVMANASIAFSVIAALSDWILGLLPVAILWDVKLNRRTKVTISILLGMGVCAGIALLVRIPLIKAFAASTDFLYQTVDTAIWTVLEPSLGIVAGCASTLRPLFEGWGFNHLSFASSSAKATGSRASSIFLPNLLRQGHNKMVNSAPGLPTRQSLYASGGHRVPSSQGSTTEFGPQTEPPVYQLSSRDPVDGKWDVERGNTVDQASLSSRSSARTLSTQDTA